MKRSASDLDDLVSILGGNVVSEDSSRFDSAVEHMYKPRESVFGAVAKDMVAAGWSIFPQEMDGNRRPGTVNGEMIKWSEQYRLATQRPDAKTIDLWSSTCAFLNVAVVLGPASGDTFVVDIDVVEEELSRQIQELADRMLGRTPLRRVGRWPKMALVYRHAPGDEIASRSPKFVPMDSPENPDRTDQGLEIISAGKAMTFYGKHHKTGRYFTWLEGPPHMLGPETAPLVTSAQVNDFLDAVDGLRQFHRAQSFDPTAVTWEWDEKQKINVPRIRQSGAAADWIEDENGKVVDGREAYLTRLAYRIVTANAGAASTDAGRARLTQIVAEQFMATAETSGRWKGASLAREAKTKVDSTARKLARGEIKPFVAKDEGGKVISSSTVRNYVPPQPRQGEIDSLDFLVPAADPSATGFDHKGRAQRQPMRLEVLPPEEGAFEARRIESDRTRVATAVQDGLLGAFRKFWDEVYDLDRRDTRVHILKAPTGAGKTSRGIAFIAEDPRTKEDYTIRGNDGEVVSEGRSPIVILLPTYANIEELRARANVLNLDGSLSDADLRQQAMDRDLIHEDDLEEKLAELRRDAKNAGLKTMIYQGKLKAGCAIADKVQMAMDAGIGTSGFCKAEVPTGEKDDKGKPVTEEKFCPHYFNYKGTGEKCPAIAQKDEIGQSHVVFMPHAFLSLSIPEELKHVRAVVADERIHHLFLHTATLDLDVFSSPRRPPRLRKKEKEEGVEATAFNEERREAAKVARAALQTGQCPAEALARHPGVNAENRPLSVVWVESAIRACQASIEREGTVTPDMDIDTLRDLCAQPTGQQVREELRFWKIVLERMEARIGEIVNEELAKSNPALAIPRTTKGDRDYRIQLQEDVKDSGETVSTIRISWRETPNWIDRPLLLLDASAAPAMISKIWAGKEVVVHDIPAALNVRVVCVADRTYSNASVVAGPGASAAEKVASARMLAKVRKALSVISAMYGWSRVVAGGSILVRRAVNAAWEGPHNVDWCHYGAMRGLDFAKHHAAAISVGRMELPTRTIDGLVAALTYDDDEPERPYDCNRAGIAAGIGPDGQPLRVPMGTQRVRMRSGHDINMPVPMFPGTWGRMIQRQYREEELLQFLGRLRPVYREGEAPVWFSLSSVIPEEVIVDDIVMIEDLLGKETAVWEAMRRCGGVLEPRIAAMTCDELFSSPEKAASLMRSAGMDVRKGTVTARIGWGVCAWRWKAADGQEGHCFARAGLDAAEDALRNAFRNYLDLELESLERVSVSRTRTMAKGRTSDKIEDELGTLPERREREHLYSRESAMELLMTASPEQLAHLRTQRAGESLPISVQVIGPEASEDGSRRSGDSLSIDEAYASMAIRKLWETLRPKDAAEAVPAPRSADGSQQIDLGYRAALLQASGVEAEPSYEAAAAHVADAVPGLLDFDEHDLSIPW